jgi:mRNA-degrading endonuclease RelE of RelBE toxin-antitoxin system
MSETTKFTPEEIKQIQDLRQANADKISEFGSIELDILLTNQRLDFLKDAKEKAIQGYKDLQQQEKELVENLNKKYGTGTIDLQTGEFIPSK